MIKIGDEYLEYDELPEVIKQVKTPDTIDVAGDFSYSFSVPKTNKNLKILKVDINRKDRLTKIRIPAVIESFGNPIHTGFLRIERITNQIELSFFSGNSEWFSMLGGLIADLDLSQFKLPLANISPSPVIYNSWTNTEGIIYPFLDRGRMKNWSVPVMDTTDFIPMVYVKTIMQSIFQTAGLKLSGEMLNDSVYTKLNAGADDQFTELPTFMENRHSYIGKTASQSINTTPQLVTFDDESYPYFDGSANNFAGNRYTADVDMSVVVSVLLQFNTSVSYILELKKNGVTIDTRSVTGTNVNNKFNSGNAISIDAGDYLEAWLSLGSGSATLLNATIDVRPVRFDATYPQFLLGSMTQQDFVTGIFRMLNVIAVYDQFSKTVTCNLFKNIRESEEDLSDYVAEYEISQTELTDEIGKKNIFFFQESEDEEQINYNELSEVPYGGGSIDSENEHLTDSNEIELPFAASFNYYNDTFQANMMRLGTYVFESSSDEVISISDVADDGGIAEFQTSTDHGFEQLDYVYITNTSTGNYVGIGRISSADALNQFKIQNLSFINTGVTPVTGNVHKVNLSTVATGKVFIGITIPNMLVSDFSYRSSIRYGSGTHTNVAYFYFVKSDIGLTIDNYKESAAFGNPFANGYTGITLLDNFYGEQKKYFNDPTLVKATMHLPFKTFHNLDQTKSFRVKTSDMNIVAFMPKLEGYISSEFPCVANLVKLE